MFSLSIMVFSGMPTIMVLSENILDIALGFKNPSCASLSQCQFWCLHRIFFYARSSGVVQNYPRHCSVGKVQKMGNMHDNANNSEFCFLSNFEALSLELPI